MDNDEFFSNLDSDPFGSPSGFFEQDVPTFTLFTPFADFKEQNLPQVPSLDQTTQSSLPKNTTSSDSVTASELSTKKISVLEDQPSPEQKILNSALREAIEAKNSTLINKLVSIGANPNCTYNDGFKPLFLCAKHETLECFEVLYSQGARLDERNSTGQTALHAAICANNVPMLKRLIELSPHFNILDTNTVSPKLTLNPLYIAILYDAVKILDFIFTQTQSNITANIITQCFPLHYAVLHAKPTSMETLLKYVHVDHKSKFGDTPLMLVARRSVKGNNAGIEARLDKIVDLLIQHNADFDASSTNGNNAFKIAKNLGKDDLANKLAMAALNKPSVVPKKVAFKPK